MFYLLLEVKLIWMHFVTEHVHVQQKITDFFKDCFYYFVY